MVLAQAIGFVFDLAGRSTLVVALGNLAGFAILFAVARLAARSGRYGQAANYYRTAIYGRWQRNPEENRRAARLELIELLEQYGGAAQVAGEYLTIWEEEPHTESLARQVGLGLMRAGAPREALSVLRTIDEPGLQDAEILATMGMAHFELNQYEEARQYLQRAAAAGRIGAEEREALDLVTRVLALDPSLRGLGAGERYRRSREVLARTVQYVGGCANPLTEEMMGPPEPQPPGVRGLLDSAAERLDRSRRPSDVNAEIEANLLLAANLWRLREQVCRGVWDEDDALARVMRKLD